MRASKSNFSVRAAISTAWTARSARPFGWAPLNLRTLLTQVGHTVQYAHQCPLLFPFENDISMMTELAQEACNEWPQSAWQGTLGRERQRENASRILVYAY